MILYFLLTLLFVACQGFFSGMETGMVSVLRPRAEHAARQGNLNAQILCYFLCHPEIMIATALIGVNISVVMASLMAKSFMQEAGIRSGIGLTIGSVLLSILMLCFEIIPKNWFREAAFRRCSRFIPVFFCVFVLLYIPVRIFSLFTGFLSSLIGRFNGGLKKSPNVVMREDFRLYLRESRTYGAVDEATASILDKAMDVPGMLVRNILIPHDEVITLTDRMSIRQAFQVCQRHNITKAPVATSHSTNQNWIGVFNIYEAIYAVDEEEWDHLPISCCMEDLPDIEADIRMEKLLERLRFSRVPFFAVIDKNKKQLGIVRPEDLAALLFDNE